MCATRGTILATGGFQMRRVSLIAVAAMILAAGAAVAGDSESYGEGVTLEKAVPIQKLMGEPDEYVGQKVRVDGVISGVCKKRGCWMQVSDPESGESVRIKVEDGVIVFPYSAMGHEAAAEGVFTAIPVGGGDQGAEQAKHEHAEGEPCDKSEEGQKAGCDAPKKGNVIYLIQGTGAVIKA
jgi:hypothetical protein